VAFPDGHEHADQAHCVQALNRCADMRLVAADHSGEGYLARVADPAW
jgi:hypothetical protein